MELHTVIAVSTMDKYCACIPYFIQSWKHLFPEITIRVLLITSSLPKFLKPYASFIECIPMHRFPSGISMEDIARQLRFFYPSYYHTISQQYAKENTDSILVSNIDTIPCSRDSILKTLSLYSNDTFVQMLDADIPEVSERFPIKYCIGQSKLWNAIFKAQSWDDIVNHMKPVDSLVYFRELLIASSIYPDNVRIAGSGNINHRSLPLEEVKEVSIDSSRIQKYSDFTLPLPIVNYMESIDLILKTILSIDVDIIASFIE
jgi:hypothetical protein